MPCSSLLLTKWLVLSNIWGEEEAVFSEASHRSNGLNGMMCIKALCIEFKSYWRCFENIILCLVMIGFLNCCLWLGTGSTSHLTLSEPFPYTCIHVTNAISQPSLPRAGAQCLYWIEKETRSLLRFFELMCIRHPGACHNVIQFVEVAFVFCFGSAGD